MEIPKIVKVKYLVTSLIFVLNRKNLILYLRSAFPPFLYFDSEYPEILLILWFWNNDYRLNLINSIL